RALEEGNLDPPQQELLSTMMSCARSQMRMIETLLDVTRIENGKKTLHARPFSVSRVVRDIADVAEFDCEKKGLSLRVLDETDLASMLLGDENGVRQIIANHVENAVKFTGQGSVTIRAEALPGDGERVDLRIGVTDT